MPIIQKNVTIPKVGIKCRRKLTLWFSLQKKEIIHKCRKNCEKDHYNDIIGVQIWQKKKTLEK